MSAASVTSEVDICNLALARLGQTKAIASVETPETPVEDLCALHYPMARRGLLRAYIFNFAKKLDQLTADPSETPAYGFATAYALPNDFIRLLTLGDHTQNDDVPASLYEIVGRYIYTDEVDDADTDTINIQYVYDNVVVSQWDTLFVNLMRLQLAKDMAYGFTLKPSLVVSVDNELADVKLQAAAIAGQEKPPRRIQRSRILTARRIGGNRRDPTRWPI